MALFLYTASFCLDSALALPKAGIAGSQAQLRSDQQDAFQKGLIALKENRIDTALEELTRAEKEQPENAKVHSFLGIALTRLSRNEEAEAEYKKAIHLDPSLEDAYRNLGFLEWQLRQPAQAMVDLEHAATLSPNDSYAHYYLGRVELESQLYEKGLRELAASGVAWPDDPEFLITVASGYLALGRKQDSTQTLDRLLSLKLTDVESVRATSLLLDLHQNEQAIHLLSSRVSTSSPGVPSWLQFDLARAYLLAGNGQQSVQYARACTESASSTDPDSAGSAWSLLGIALARHGASDRAITALRQAASTEPQKEEHWLNLTHELMTLGQFQEAIEAAQEGLSAEPRSYALHLRLGAANLAANHYPEAETIFRELAAAGDPLPTSYVGLAQVLLRMGRSEEAVSELEDARQKLGPNFLISYFLGLSWDRTPTPSRAVDAFQEAIRLNPESAEAHFGLGKTQLAIGNAKEAVVQLEETLRINPANVQAQHLLIQAKHRAGQAHPSPIQSETQPLPEQNLLGDFILPPWQLPPRSAGP